MCQHVSALHQLFGESLFKKVAEQELGVWFYSNCAIHILIRLRELLRVEIHWQPIRTFSSAACLLRQGYEWGSCSKRPTEGSPLSPRHSITQGPLHRTQPNQSAERPLKKSPYLSQAIPGKCRKAFISERTLIFLPFSSWHLNRTHLAPSSLDLIRSDQSHAAGRQQRAGTTILPPNTCTNTHA